MPNGNVDIQRRLREVRTRIERARPGVLEDARATVEDVRPGVLEDLGQRRLMQGGGPLDRIMDAVGGRGGGNRQRSRGSSGGQSKKSSSSSSGSDFRGIT